MERPPREICIIMMSAIGDAVHVLPVVNALKRKWPDCRITWVIQPVPYQLVKNHENVDDFILFRRRRGLAGWRAFRETGRELRERRFDLVIALQVYFKAGVLTAMAHAPVKLGFDRTRARDANWMFTTHRIPVHPVQHVQDQYFEFLDYLGVDPEPVEWRVRFTDEERVAQRAFFDGLSRPVCSVVLGTSKLEKNWLPDRYARVVDALKREWGYTVLLVGGPSEAERALADEVLRRSGGMPRDELGDDLRRLAWLLDGSDLVISPDTGPLHLARALDRPVIGLYGYTNPKRAGPYAKYEDLLVDGYAKYPGEPYVPSPKYRKDGMLRVTVTEVLDKVRIATEKYVRPALREREGQR